MNYKEYSDQVWGPVTYWDYLMDTIWNPFVCSIIGHDMEDHDPGDPEVGPQPDINCNRCGRSWG